MLALGRTRRWKEGKILLNSPPTPPLTQHFALTQSLMLALGWGRTGRFAVFGKTKGHKGIKYKLDIKRGLNLDQNENSDF